MQTLAQSELEEREYDPEAETYRARFHHSDTVPSMAVVAALSELTETDPTELNPLHASVDADALDRLTSRCAVGERSVTFQVHQYTVSVHTDGIVDISRSDQEPGSEDRTDD